MGSTMVPLSQINRRMTRLGRLRFGELVPTKDGKKTYPKAIDRWIMSSNDRRALEQVAEIYGGEVVPFDNPKAIHSLKVRTEANEINVTLRSDAMPTQAFERWEGSKIKRRCDGETMTGYVYDGHGGKESKEGLDCRCNFTGLQECKPKTRISFILPDVRLAGVWELASESWNALAELPEAASLILAASGMGLCKATLRLEHRQADGGAKKFIVPVLGSIHTLDELAAGAARYSMGQPPAAALVSGFEDTEYKIPSIDEAEVIEVEES